MIPFAVLKNFFVSTDLRFRETNYTFLTSKYIPSKKRTNFSLITNFGLNITTSKNQISYRYSSDGIAVILTFTTFVNISIYSFNSTISNIGYSCIKTYRIPSGQLLLLILR